MTKTLLVLSDKAEDQEFAAGVASQAGLSLSEMNDPGEAADFINENDSPVVFVDSSTRELYQEFENAIQDKIGLFSDKINSNLIHYISAEDLQEVNYLLQSPIFGHYISRSYGSPQEAGSRYGLIVKASLQERVFGLKSLLGEKAKIQVVPFSSTKQKQQGVEAVKNYLLAAKFKARMASTIANAVDELLMNAMFDAPVDELGKPLYSTTPRNAEIQLVDKSAVEMQVGYDGRYAAIMAIDQFGSLDKAKLFSHISKRYVEEEYKVRTSTAGAGIGLATIFRSGGSFLFASEKGQRTEVTVFFQRTDNFREFKDQFRFISTQFYF